MEWPNAVSLTRPQVAALARRLRAAGFRVRTKDLDVFAINIVRAVAGSDPAQQRTVKSAIEQVLGR